MWNTENRHIRCLSVLIGQGRTNIYYLSPDEYTVILVFNLLLPHLSLCYTQDGWIENTCNGFSWYRADGPKGHKTYHLVLQSCLKCCIKVQLHSRLFYYYVNDWLIIYDVKYQKLKCYWGFLFHFVPWPFCCNTLCLPLTPPLFWPLPAAPLQQKPELTVVTIPKPLENYVAISSKCQPALQARERRGICALSCSPLRE